MAGARGRFWQAALAVTIRPIRIRRWTGIEGTAAAKYSKSMTMRRGTDNRMARPRMGYLRNACCGVILSKGLCAWFRPYRNDIHRQKIRASSALLAIHEN